MLGNASGWLVVSGNARQVREASIVNLKFAMADELEFDRMWPLHSRVKNLLMMRGIGGELHVITR